MPPLALYIHIPWCVRKCPYCDFNSHTASSVLPEAEYLAALQRDLTQDAHLAAGRPLSSIFFGGGTPSLLRADTVDAILRHAQTTCGFTDGIEITLEANPGAVDQAQFQGFRAAGVNRLSIGVQSFHDTHLQALGRIHSAGAAQAAITAAQQAGFTRINIDLMHGLPEQTHAQAMDDLHTAIASGVSHISWYQLTIEPNTAFHSAPPVLPQDDTLWAIQEDGLALLAQAGFAQYEVSAFAREGAECRHNRNYWEFGDYLGIGAGAHGKITAGNGAVLRYQKTRMPTDYLNLMQRARDADLLVSDASPAIVPKADLPLEFMLNALRLRDGVPASLFTERTGIALAEIEPALIALRQQGLLTNDSDRLATTPVGFRWLNTVLESF